tara:strand:- start:2907 stop:4049 length:1143 start_codon:yes stop_codon:yes gene_type:complete
MTTKGSREIFIITGESSGDQHAAKYVKEHLLLNKELYFSGIGQESMRDEGVSLIYNSEDISVVGLTEVIFKYHKIKSVMDLAKKYIYEKKPALIVLVDYVEFNLKIASYAKSLGIPTLFYIAPQVWAWRENRINNIVKVVDHLAVVFPFEYDIFSKFTTNVTYVGHPLADDNELSSDDTNYHNKKYDLGVFPGSRESEIKNNIYTMLDCIKPSKGKGPDYSNIKIFYSNDKTKKLLEKMLPISLHDSLKSGKDRSEIKQCKKAITASGTITLELALLGIPMVIVYRLSAISYLIMKRLVKLKYIGLVNLILGENLGDKMIVKEYIQPKYHDQVEIMAELDKIDNDTEYRDRIRNKYLEIRKKLKPGAAKNLAHIANKLIF